MKPDKIEQSLNNVVRELCNGLADLAEKLRCGAKRDELADTMAAMSERICEHWPNCFTEMKAQKRMGPKTQTISGRKTQTEASPKTQTITRKTQPSKGKPAKAKP